MEFNLYYKMQFGYYAQVYGKTENYTNEQTVGPIFLITTHNIQGGYKLYRLKKGKKQNIVNSHHVR